MTDREELDQINKVKYQKNGIIGVFTRRYISSNITKLLVKTPLKPNHITFLSLMFGLTGCYLLSTGQPNLLIASGIFIFLSKILDGVDGEVARLKNLVSKRGGWLDGISDRFKENVLFFCLALGLYNQSGDIKSFIYGFVAIIAIHMLSIVLEHTGQMDKGALQRTQEDTLIVKIAKKLGIKPQFMALQADTYLFIAYVGIMLNQLEFVLWFFMVIMNLYWLAIVFFVYLKTGKEEEI